MGKLHLQFLFSLHLEPGQLLLPVLDDHHFLPGVSDGPVQETLQLQGEESVLRFFLIHLSSFRKPVALAP